jgi:hypothetical protein
VGVAVTNIWVQSKASGFASKLLSTSGFELFLDVMRDQLFQEVL